MLPGSLVVSHDEYTERFSRYSRRALSVLDAQLAWDAARGGCLASQLSAARSDVVRAQLVSYAEGYDFVEAVAVVARSLSSAPGLRAGVTLSAGSVLVWAAACASSRPARPGSVIMGWEFDGEAFVREPTMGASLYAPARKGHARTKVVGERSGMQMTRPVFPPVIPQSAEASILYVKLRTGGASPVTAAMSVRDALALAPACAG